MTDALALWQIASALFFLYTLAVALLRRSLPMRQRALLLAGIGLTATLLSSLVIYHVRLHDVLLPPSLLLLAYWSSGALFRRPMARAEALLIKADRMLGLPITGVPRPLAECLEAAYLSIYPAVGIAFVLLMTVGPDPNPDRFWSVVLITDYACFAMLPWLQTRPPRALERRDPWRSSLRALNIRLLGSASIHVNTCPSGHAAEAAAMVLLLLGTPLPILLTTVVVALAISAGAVLGRYHYALDALAGWLVAGAVWLLVG